MTAPTDSSSPSARAAAAPDVAAPLDDPVRLALPKGRIQDGVFALLEAAGMAVRGGARHYRPSLPLPGWEAKILKPQSIVRMLQAGSRDLGFTGADWVAELDADLVELLDTGLDPVRIVAAVPEELTERGWPDCAPPAGGPRQADGSRPWVVASEYPRLTQQWIERRGLDARFVRSFGATEVYPPEDADCIVDNTATGSTLRAHELQIVDELMTSSTRLFARPQALEDPEKRARIEHLVLLLKSVLDARRRVIVELNVPADRLEEVIAVLPSMREPTVAPLHGAEGFAVKSAVLRDELPLLIPRLRARGGSDILVAELAQLVP